MDLYQGSMESCELVLLSNGSGWYEWSNFGGAFEMLRLQWKRPDPGQLAVLIQEYLGGTWTPGGLVTRYRAERQHHESRSVITSYVIHPDVDALRRPVTLLELGKEIGRANRYALMRRDVRAIDDPIRATESGTGRRAAWLFSPWAGFHGARDCPQVQQFPPWASRTISEWSDRGADGSAG